jgi:hypothetical protein
VVRSAKTITVADQLHLSRFPGDVMRGYYPPLIDDDNH